MSSQTAQTIWRQALIKDTFPCGPGMRVIYHLISNRMVLAGVCATIWHLFVSISFQVSIAIMKESSLASPVILCNLAGSQTILSATLASTCQDWIYVVIIRVTEAFQIRLRDSHYIYDCSLSDSAQRFTLHLWLQPFRFGSEIQTIFMTAAFLIRLRDSNYIYDCSLSD